MSDEQSDPQADLYQPEIDSRRAERERAERLEQTAASLAESYLRAKSEQLRRERETEDLDFGDEGPSAD